MTLAPLLDAPLAIQLHAVSALLAFPLGALVLWRRKGTRLHKTLGWVWVGLMLTTATSALFINELRLIGPFSPIHLFVILTYWGIGRAMVSVIVHGDVRRHRGEMQGVYFGALVVAGSFTLLPGRRMHAVLFGADAGWPSSLLTIGLLLLGASWLWRRLRPGRRARV